MKNIFYLIFSIGALLYSKEHLKTLSIKTLKESANKFSETTRNETDKVNNNVSDVIPNENIQINENENFTIDEEKELSEQNLLSNITAIKNQNVENSAIQSNFSIIDKHTLNCPEKLKTNVKEIAQYLSILAKTEIEKARAIFVWITNNISYDDQGYRTGKYGDLSSQGVLKSKKAVCTGFSNLFYDLGIEMGLEIKKLDGYCKGYSYRQGEVFKDSDHAWNMIKIDGNWRMFDATWGEGYAETIGGKMVSVKSFDEKWFNVDPYEAIFTHFPEDETLLTIKPKITKETFERLPKIHKSLFCIGFKGEDIYRIVLEDINAEFPQTYPIETYININSGPVFKNLKKGMNYYFEFYIPKGISVSVIDASNNWTYLEGENGIFKINYKPTKKGRLSINLKYESEIKTYLTFMEYYIE